MTLYIQLSGGIGNQLFQYSKYLELKEDFSQLDIRLMCPILRFGANGNQHSRISELYPQAVPVFKKLLTELAFYMGRRAVNKRKYFTYSDAWWSMAGEFNPTEYGDYENILVRSLFQRKPREATLEYLKREYWKVPGRRRLMFGAESGYSAMHIRLGDYLTSPIALNKIGPLAASYYRNAYEMLKSKKEKMLVVTNGTAEQVRDILNADLDKKYILNKMGDVESFNILANAKYLCIGNSTFSIWSAYLADANLVIAPSRWLKSASMARDYRILYVDDWQIVSE